MSSANRRYSQLQRGSASRYDYLGSVVVFKTVYANGVQRVWHQSLTACDVRVRVR